MQPGPVPSAFCRDHPDAPATRSCINCRSPLCKNCGSVPLTHRPIAGAVICSHCEQRVPPHVWNRFAAERDDSPGERLRESLMAPRTALVRAAFGSIPAGSSALVSWFGLIGWGWLITTLLHGATVPAFVRTGWGLGLSFPLAIPLVLFAAACHAFQPPGPGSPASFVQALQLVATGFSHSALIAAACGFLALALASAGLGSGVVIALTVVAALASASGAAATGWGLALRRGSPLALGLAFAAACLVVTAGMCALAMYLRAHPPWGSAWDH